MIVEKTKVTVKMLFFASHFTSPSTLPNLFPSPLSNFILSLPFPQVLGTLPRSIFQCFMLEFFLIFILLVGKLCAETKKGNDWYIWPYVLFIEDSMIKCAKNKQTKLNSWQVCLIFNDLLCLTIKVQELG